jgi:hypothetical protein
MLVSRLSPRRKAVFGLVATAARNAVEAAGDLRDVCDRYPEGRERARLLHEREERGDELVALLSAQVQRALTTPVDARDLAELAIAIDRIVDAVDAAASALFVLAPAALPEQARAQARTLVAACERVADAAARLHRAPDLGREVADVRALEEDGDRLRRDAVAALFHSGLPPVEIVRLKSVHEALEEAIDACRTAVDRMAMLAFKERW